MRKSLIKVNLPDDQYHERPYDLPIICGYKKKGMPKTEFEELTKQNEYWKYKLQLIEDENIQFKTRLANLLQNSVPKAQLDQLEDFFNRFIALDEQIILLKHEVREQLQLLAQYPVATPDILASLQASQQKLEARVVIVHSNFDQLNSEFSYYITCGGLQ